MLKISLLLNLALAVGLIFVLLELRPDDTLILRWHSTNEGYNRDGEIVSLLLNERWEVVYIEHLQREVNGLYTLHFELTSGTIHHEHGFFVEKYENVLELLSEYGDNNRKVMRLDSDVILLISEECEYFDPLIYLERRYDFVWRIQEVECPPEYLEEMLWGQPLLAVQ